MQHPIHRIKSFHTIGPYTLKIQFDDDVIKEINLQPILKGAVYGALQQLSLFNQARIDPEVNTIVWPNGADFDPALLYHWDEHISELTERANTWNEPQRVA